MWASSDLAHITAFLRDLHGASSGLVHICASGDMAGRAFDSVDAAADAAHAYDGREGVYVRCCTLRPDFEGNGRRGEAEDSWDMPGLFMDLDVGEVGHAPRADGLPHLPSEAAAREVIAHLPPPTFWVATGGGFHAWWLFSEPWQLRTPEDRTAAKALLRAWQGSIEARAHALGHGVDLTDELARVLRLPGTVNRKRGQARPCRVVEGDRPRYQREELAELPELMQARPSTPASRPSVASRYQPSARDDLPPCPEVSRVTQSFQAELAQGSGGRHAAMLRTQLKLLRLSEYGHAGVNAALELAHDSYVEAVSADRSHSQAEREWSSALAGSLPMVGQPKEHVICQCRVEELRRRVNNSGLYAPRTYTTDVRVMRALTEAVQRHGSLRVQESQRQIAVLAEKEQKTVSRSLRRLCDLGLVTRIKAKRHGDSDHYVVTAPEAVQMTSTKNPLGDGGKLVEVITRAPVHRLFGSAGLRSKLDTFAALPLYGIPLGRRRWAVRLAHGQRGREHGNPSDPRSWSRPIPDSKIGPGLTPRQVVDRTGRSPDTVRRHLRRLEQAGLVRHDDGRWHRLHFDPDHVASLLGIPDTVARREARHLRERRLLHTWMASLDSDHPLATALEEDGPDNLYVSFRDGDVRWVHKGVRPADGPPGPGRAIASYSEWLDNLSQVDGKDGIVLLDGDGGVAGVLEDDNDYPWEDGYGPFNPEGLPPWGEDP